ncbi:MAG: hypothetical protein JSU58_09085 [Dehalococcoidales bacterium]|nr:MAG: hypothetical protein JSU58_09085 [Dehalococcoidales bacterium]
MDFGDLSEVMPVILVIIGLVAIQLFLRRKGGSRSPHQYVVHAILSDIRINLRLVEILMDGEQIKRFAINGWKTSRNNIEFLSQNIQSALTDAFDIAQDYNEQVSTTTQFKTSNYEASIDTVKLKDRLQKCKSALEDWLMNNVGTTDPGGKTGIFDSIIGRR